MSTVPSKVTASKTEGRDDEVYVYGDALRLPCLRLVSLLHLSLFDHLGRLGRVQIESCRVVKVMDTWTGPRAVQCRGSRVPARW